MSRTKQLGQARPGDTNAVSIFSPSTRDRHTVKNIIICNTTTSVATYRLFVDEDGTTYDQTTAIAYDVSIAANTTDLWEVELYMNDPGGNLAVRSGTSSALTFTVNGDDGSL